MIRDDAIARQDHEPLDTTRHNKRRIGIVVITYSGQGNSRKLLRLPRT